MPSTKSERRRRHQIDEAATQKGHRLSHKEIRLIAKSLAGRPVEDHVVDEEIAKIRIAVDNTARRRDAIHRFSDVARGDYRIVDGMWETQAHINIARTGIRFWIQIDEVRPGDRSLFEDPCAEISLLRALGGRLKSASHMVLRTVRKQIAELDAAADAVASAEDQIFVKSAIRQLQLSTTIPAAIVATIQTVHGRALDRSISVAALAANPHAVRKIVAPGQSQRKRRILALIGPTNSGKTHEAITMLTAAKTGAYLAPLRLMAMEGWDRMRSADLSCDMTTGEESISSQDATHLSATIETAQIERRFDVVVVDEAQLLADPERGWAWTRAVFHSNADTILLTGSADCLPILERIAQFTGETVEVKNFERRAPLRAMPSPIEITDLRPGDAVIAFSRTAVLAMKSEIARLINPATGKHFRVATIYGALGPEVRRSEAGRFSRGDAEILVATDAIGMGLNLPIDRVVFSAMVKFDGRIVRDLTDSEIRQIGGRAGRSGQAEGGFVGHLAAAGGHMMKIRQALSQQPEPAFDDRPYIRPTVDQIERGMDALEVETLSKALPAVANILRTGPDYRCHVDPETVDLLQTIETYDIPLKDLHEWIGCPMPLRDVENRRTIAVWASLQQNGLTVRAPSIEYQGGIEIDDHRLQGVERAVSQAGAYLWLARKWPDIYEDVDVAVAARRDGNRMIEDALKQRQISRNCRGCGKPIGYRVRHDYCRTCTDD